MSSSQGYPPLPSLSKANRSIYCVVNCHICFLNLVRTEFISSLVGFCSFLNVLTKSWVWLFFYLGGRENLKLTQELWGLSSPLLEALGPLHPHFGSSGTSASPLLGALGPLHHHFRELWSLSITSLSGPSTSLSLTS